LKAEELQFNALDRIKATAEKWLGTIASLTGVFGIIALISGPSDISKLNPQLRGLVVLALIIAVSCAFGSIILAALAAQGVPTRIWADGQQLKAETANRVDEAVTRLNWSRYLVVLVVISLGISIGITWYGNWNATSKTAEYFAVYNTGEVACGELSADGGELSLKDKSGSFHILENVKSLDSISGCPKEAVSEE
jgi:hypothetical protein